MNLYALLPFLYVGLGMTLTLCAFTWGAIRNSNRLTLWGWIFVGVGCSLMNTYLKSILAPYHTGAHSELILSSLWITVSAVLPVLVCRGLTIARESEDAVSAK